MMYEATRVINTGYCYNLGCGGGHVMSYGSELTASRQEGEGYLGFVLPLDEAKHSKVKALPLGFDKTLALSFHWIKPSIAKSKPFHWVLTKRLWGRTCNVIRQ